MGLPPPLNKHLVLDICPGSATLSWYFIAVASLIPAFLISPDDFRSFIRSFLNLM